MSAPQTRDRGLRTGKALGTDVVQKNIGISACFRLAAKPAAVKSPPAAAKRKPVSKALTGRTQHASPTFANQYTRECILNIAIK
ncbi:hypothetical protein [Herminiimonas sp. CN]|uniref:hypothetical protein n=1 Tax=Herminiimonas sp. CN TaxID=1349818 RepID=UPI0012DD69B7|nr:hypothetical protein [Herminiimonas sp. CN]